MRARLGRLPEGYSRTGVLMVTRMIDEANELAATINDQAGFDCATARHSNNRIPSDEMARHDVLVITHSAYVDALEDIVEGDGANRWTNFVTWAGGSRFITVIDECLADIIGSFQVRSDDVDTALFYIDRFKDLEERYPDPVAALREIADVLRQMETTLALEKDSAELRESKMVWKGALEGRVTFPERYRMKSLRQAMRGLKYDQVALQKESLSDRKRIALRVDKILKDCEAILSKWAYYTRKGKDVTLNASALLVPDDLPGPLVLDATASQEILWDHSPRWSINVGNTKGAERLKWALPVPKILQ